LADHVSPEEGTRWPARNVVNASAVTSYFAAILYALDLIEHDGEIYAIAHFLIARSRWRACCAIARPASYSMNTSPTTALSSSRTPAGSMPKVSFKEDR
jgi:hypothetical protein